MKLQIENLSKTYPGDIHALKNVSLEIPTGMFGLLGPNGAGKSTLMRIIVTLQNADHGAIRLNGTDVLEEKHNIRQVLGYLPQEFGIYPDVSAEMMLDHIAVLKGIIKQKERKAMLTKILHQTNLYEVGKRKLGTYSGGMKQRFGIAQALLGNPQLLIVDEPTAGLDPGERNRFHNILSEISENIIVMLSTHIVDDVRQLCTQMAIIHQGEILLSTRTDEAMRKLQGKVWQKIIRKQEITEYDEHYKIILTRLFAGNMLIHVLSDVQPEGFEIVHPDLEDVYFSTIKKLEIRD